MKGNPNDELRFLMGNPTRSDFFMVTVKIGFIYLFLTPLISKNKGIRIRRS
ncbi:hypothetical protein DEU44_3210 [Priestia megaterium]|nr:hypothetical protein DEU44_3210 [Priestia megaterium]